MAMSPAVPATTRRPPMPPLTAMGIAIVAVLVGVALLGPLLTPHDPYQFSIRMNEAPSTDHWLGTDDQGHDVLSRVIAGTRLSLLFGAGAALVALALGSALPLIALSLGRVVETAVFSVFDLIRALPDILFALAFVAAFEPGALSVMVALGVSVFTHVRDDHARDMAPADGTPLCRRSTSAWRDPRPPGDGWVRCVRRTSVGALVTQFAIILPRCIVLESVMSFLGLGVSPETPTWGRMIANATRFSEAAPHAVLAPILALSIATFGMAIVGNALRRRFDPDRRRIAG